MLISASHSEVCGLQMFSKWSRPILPWEPAPSTDACRFSLYGVQESPELMSPNSWFVSSVFHVSSPMSPEAEVWVLCWASLIGRDDRLHRNIIKGICKNGFQTVGTESPWKWPFTHWRSREPHSGSVQSWTPQKSHPGANDLEDSSGATGPLSALEFKEIESDGSRVRFPSNACKPHCFPLRPLCYSVLWCEVPPILKEGFDLQLILLGDVLTDLPRSMSLSWFLV